MSNILNKSLNREIALFKQSIERMEERMEKISMLYKMNKLREVI
jgi:hypothetical protein